MPSVWVLDSPNTRRLQINCNKEEIGLKIPFGHNIILDVLEPDNPLEYGQMVLKDEKISRGL